MNRCGFKIYSTIVLVLGVLLVVSCSRLQLTEEQYIEKGKNYLAQGQTRAAIIEFKNALQVNSKNATAREMLGRIYVEVGDGVSGEKELTRAIELGDDSVETKIDLAHALLLQGKYHEVLQKFQEAQNSELQLVVADAYMATDDFKRAKSYIDKANSLAADSIPVKLAMSKLAIFQNDYERANTILHDVLTSAPESKLAWRYSGILAMRQANFSEAENDFQKVVDLDNSDLISAQGIQAWIDLIRSQLAQKQLAKAEQSIKRLKSRAPTHPGVDFLAALVSFEKGEFDTARNQLQSLNRKLPDYLPAILLLGATHYALGDYEQASVYLARYVNEVPSQLQARKLLAATRIKQQRSQDALELLTAAKDSAPDDGQLIAMIGEASIASGNVLKGTEYLKRAKKAKPDDPSIRAELARVLMGQGDYDQAIKELEAIAGKYAKPRDILLVAAHLRKKDYAQARKLAKQLASSNPGPDTETLLGGVELISGARIAARSHFEKALTLDKDYLPAMLNLGKMDLEDGYFKEASDKFNAVLLQQPANLSAIFGLAQVEERQGDEQQAVALIEKARETNKDAVLPRVILCRYYLQRRDINKALMIAREFRQDDFNNPGIILLVGKVYLLSGNSAKSLELFQKLVKKLPKEPGAYLELANAQANANRMDEAKQSLRQALRISSDFYQASYALAELEIRSGNTSDALTIAHQLQQRQESSQLGFLLAGDIYVQEKAYAKARQQYSKARERGNSSAITLKLASTHEKLNQYDKAVTVLTDWLQKHPDDNRVQMELAQQYQNQRQYGKAIQIMNKVLENQPNNAVVLNNLAWVYYLQGDSRALDYAERAHQAQPGAGAIIDTLGWLLVQNDQQLTRAVELLREASGKAPNIPEIKYHLAVALSKTNQKTEAKALLTEVVGSNKPFSDLQNAKDLLQQLQ